MVSGYRLPLLLLHSAFMLSVVKMLLKGEVGGLAFNSHGNYIVDHVKSWKNHGIVFLSFCGNPVITNKAKGKQYTGLTLAQQHLNLAKWKKLEQNEIDFSQGFSQKLVPISCSVFNSAH